MRKNAPSSAALFLLLSFLFSSCKKYDVPCKDDLLVSGCDIATITLPYFEGGTRTGTFTYNAYGKPASILFDKPGSTGYPGLFLFRYDAANRLTDFIEAFDSSTYDAWHVYKYNSAGQIIADSVYIWGEINGQHPSETDILDPYATAYAYDAEGRMTKAIVTWEGETSESTSYNYTYNSSGNATIIRADGFVVRPADAVYDTKINLNRTNAVWMFVSRDYSRNNYKPATSYNAKGLPLEFASAPTPFFLQNEEGSNQFTYSCDNKN